MRNSRKDRKLKIRHNCKQALDNSETHAIFGTKDTPRIHAKQILQKKAKW